MKKNVAGQYLHVIAFDVDGRVSGDAANITCKIAIDDGAYADTDDAYPTEISTSGEYKFTLTQAETNGYKVAADPSSKTSGVQCLALPSNVIYTTDEATSLTNQTAIISLLQANPALMSANIADKSVYNGDSWKAASANGNMTFAVTIDATGMDVVLLVYDKADVTTKYKEVACTVTSATLITAADFAVDWGSSLNFGARPLSAQCQYVVVARTDPANEDTTLAFGSFFVTNRSEPVAL